MPKTGYFSEKK